MKLLVVILIATLIDRGGTSEIYGKSALNCITHIYENPVITVFKQEL